MKGIITLCGSTKFKKEFGYLKYWLTMNDYIYLSVGSYHHSESNESVRNTIIANKELLDRLHKEKISMSDGVIIIDVNGYIDESTKSELDFAERNNKRIYYWGNQSYLNLGVK